MNGNKYCNIIKEKLHLFGGKINSKLWNLLLNLAHMQQCFMYILQCPYNKSSVCDIDFMNAFIYLHVQRTYFIYVLNHHYFFAFLCLFCVHFLFILFYFPFITFTTQYTLSQYTVYTVHNKMYNFMVLNVYIKQIQNRMGFVFNAHTSYNNTYQYAMTMIHFRKIS